MTKSEIWKLLGRSVDLDIWKHGRFVVVAGSFDEAYICFSLVARPPRRDELNITDVDGREYSGLLAQFDTSKRCSLAESL